VNAALVHCSPCGRTDDALAAGHQHSHWCVVVAAEQDHLELLRVAWDHFGIAWNHSGMAWNHSESRRIALDYLGSLGITQEHSGSLRITWDHLGLVGITLGLLGITQEHFEIAWDHFGITWDCLEQEIQFMEVEL
jgi:hypothetical protein